MQSEPYDTSHPSATFHLQAFDPAAFPKVADLIRKNISRDEVDPPREFALYAQVFARFTASQGSEPLRLHFTGDHRAPIIVSGGDSFVGVVSPALLGQRGTARYGDKSSMLRRSSGPNLWPELFGGEDE